MSPNKTESCINCHDVINTTDTKNGRDRQFCRYSGKPQCSDCLKFFTRGTKVCDDCRVELTIKSKCVKCNKLVVDGSTQCVKCNSNIAITKKCSKCNQPADNTLDNCVTCRIKLREPSCVKEYSMYVTGLVRARNEMMADPFMRIDMQVIHEIFMGFMKIEQDQRIKVTL